MEKLLEWIVKRSGFSDQQQITSPEHSITLFLVLLSYLQNAGANIYHGWF